MYSLILLVAVQIISSHQQIQLPPQSQQKQQPWQFDGKFDNVTKNKRLVAKVLLSLQVRDESYCIANCLMNNQCKSTNFNTKTKDCELVGTSMNDGETLKESENWIHYDQNVEVKDDESICIPRTDIKPYSVKEDVCCAKGWFGLLCQKESPLVKNANPTLNVPYWEVTIPTLQDFTICGWMNPAIYPVSSGSTVFTLHSVSSGSDRIFLDLHPTKGFEFRFKAFNYFSFQNIAITQDVWHHFCFSWHLDGSTSHFNVFLNGRYAESKSESTQDFDGGDYFIVIGNDMDDQIVNQASAAFIGMLTDWNMYKKRLNADEILTVYHGDKVSDEDELLVWNYRERINNYNKI